MNKTIKVIDLLNKIANGEEVPKEIKRWKETYLLNVNHGFITCTSESGYQLDLLQILNDEVEIIEESEQEIDIQAIEELWANRVGDSNQCRDDFMLKNRDKINELIRAVKELDNKIKEK